MQPLLQTHAACNWHPRLWHSPTCMANPNRPQPAAQTLPAARPPAQCATASPTCRPGGCASCWASRPTSPCWAPRCSSPSCWSPPWAATQKVRGLAEAPLAPLAPLLTHNPRPPLRRPGQDHLYLLLRLGHQHPAADAAGGAPAHRAGASPAAASPPGSAAAGCTCAPCSRLTPRAQAPHLRPAAGRFLCLHLASLRPGCLHPGQHDL